MLESSRVDAQMMALVARVQAGDTAAFADLVERCYRRIHRWALGWTGDPDDAEDVTQEVLVRLHHHLSRYRGQARFTTWLYQITRNAAIDHERRRQRRVRAAQRHLLLEESARAATPGPDAGIERAELLVAVRAAFKDLPPRQREVFDLVDLQGYAAVEAAEMLDMKPVTARAHLFRARRSVRRAVLERHPYLTEEHDR